MIGVALGSSSIGIALFSGVGALCWLGYLVWLMRISGNQLRLLAAWMAREAIVVSLIFIPLFAAKTLAVEGIGANCVIPAAVLSASLAFARLAIIFRRKPEK